MKIPFLQNAWMPIRSCVGCRCGIDDGAIGWGNPSVCQFNALNLKLFYEK
jgi:hypothetical protein